MTNINALRNLLNEKVNEGCIEIEDFGDNGINIYFTAYEGQEAIYDALDGHDNIELANKIPQIFEECFWFYTVDGMDIRVADMGRFEHIPADITNAMIDYYMYKFK